MNINKPDPAADQPRYYLLAGIVWKLIQNNPVSTNLYLGLLLLDLCYQVLFILALYSEASCFPRELGKLDPVLAMGISTKDYSSVGLYTVFGLLLFILAFVSIEVILIKQTPVHRKYLYPCVAAILTLFKTILQTGTIQIIIITFSQFKDKNSASESVIRGIVEACVIVLYIPLLYLSTYFFNLLVPNVVIPWAETNTKSYFSDSFYKLCLLLAYQYRKSVVVFHIMISFSLCLLCYKLVYRTRNSYIFNKSVSVVYLLSDTILIHLIFFLTFAHAIRRPSHFIIVALLLPISVVSTMKIVYTYQRSQYERKTNDSKLSQTKYGSYLNLLLNMNWGSNISKVELLKIKTEHSLSCDTYAKIQSKQFNKKGNIMSQVQEQCNENPYLINGEDQISNLERQDTQSQNQNNFQSIAKCVTNEVIGTQVGESVTDITTFKAQSFKLGHKKNRKSHLFSSFDFGDSFKTQASLRNNKQKFRNPSHQRQDQPSCKELQKFVSHMFKHHLPNDKKKDFRLILLQIYYTLHFRKNKYLAHFQLYQLLEQAKKAKFLNRHQKLIFKHFMEDQLKALQEQNQEMISLDIQKLLELNSFLSRFDQGLSDLADDIKEFWSLLMAEKDSRNIYEHGLAISQNLNEVELLYQEIQEKQGDTKEFKVYLQMAAFYRYVIFKNSECEQELHKAQQAFQTNKLSRNDSDLITQSKEKGIIVSTLDIKHPMTVSFINSFGSQLLQYQRQELVGNRVNAVMPQFISEYHSKFMEHFLQKGTHSMINNKRNLFLKQKSGYVVPVTTYLFVNFTNQDQMVFMFEQSNDFQPFDNDDHINVYSLLLLDEQDCIQELSDTCLDVCQLSYPILKVKENITSVKPALDDLFECVNQGDTLDDAYTTEILVRSKYEEYLDFLFNEEEEKYESQRKASILSMHNRFNLDSNGLLSEQQLYKLKIFKETFMKKQLEMKIVAIKPSVQFLSTNAFGMVEYPCQNSRMMASQSSPYADKPGQFGDLSPNTTQVHIHFEGDMDLSSLSSQSGSSTSFEAMFQKFNNQAIKIKSQRLPRTLRIITQLVIVMFGVMFATSLVSLILAKKNFSEVSRAVKNSKLTLTRINSINSARMLTRGLVHVANDNFKYDNEGDKGLIFTYYVMLMGDFFTDFKQAQDEFNAQRLYISDKYKYITFWKFGNVKDLSSERMLSSQAINLYISYGFDFVNTLQQYGDSALHFNQSWAKMGLPAKYQDPGYNLFEQLVANILYNSRQSLFEQVRDFQVEYNNITINQIHQNFNYSNIAAIISVIVFILCAVVIIPMLSMIYDRVLYLMKIFFTISNADKSNMIERITKYKDSYLINENSHLQMSIVHKNIRRKQICAPKVVKPQKTDLQSLEISKKHSEESQKSYKSRRNSSQSAKRNSTDSSSDEDKSKVKKTNLTVQKQVQFDNENTSLIKSFRAKVQKSKQRAIVFISILILLLSSYFLANYLLGEASFSYVEPVFQTLNIVFQRQTCGMCLLSAIQDKMSLNTTYLMENGTIDYLQYYFNLCQPREASYHTQILQSYPVYLAPIRQFIDDIENDKFCDTVFSKPFTLTGNVDAIKLYRLPPDQCKTIFGGIGSLGLSNIYSYIYKNMEQDRVTYYNAIKTYTTSWDLFGKLLQSVASPQAVLMLLATEPQKMLQEMTEQAILDFFENKSLHFTIVFILFIAVLVSIFVAFLLIVFKKLKRQMLMSNKLLYIIDFDTLSIENRTLIDKFLNSF